MISILLRPTRPVAELPGLSLLAGLAVCAAVRASGAEAAVRWPNDVVCGERKLAGILPELADDGRVLLGCGINAGMTAEQLPPTDRLPPTSLLVETGHVPDRSMLRTRLLDELRRRLAIFDRDGLAGLATEIRTHDALRGRTVRLRLASGEVRSGRAEGIAPDGALIVDGQPHHAGEVDRVA